MAKAIHRVSVVLRSVETLPGDIRLLELADRDDWPLPPFTAGAHVDLHLPSGRIRQYSLCGDPAENTRYRIAVAREAAGRGGSAEVHAALRPGQELLLSLPRNNFPLVPSGRVVMVAGGIGLTPFLSMLPDLTRTGRDFVLHVCAKAPERHGFTAALGGLAPGRLALHFSRDGTRLDLAALVAGLGPEDHLYVCGPAGMMAEARRLGAGLGARLHLELFGAGEATGHTAYEVELARSGAVIPVAAGETMLEALRGAGLDIPSSCEAGVCLECRTRYLAGTPEHRDLAMPAADRHAWLTPCVSGCAGGRIVLDLPNPDAPAAG
ncbi:PDR/VanB family oxidoreductase [Oceanicella sp. SM1341]|uniref:PDR/VanB family oxidoreductase n=1 Tax=Oceanicella sp. SM1341 TaxID=1548889 RepID=UPI000E515A1D|nr:PDR/VanB family oxidoreductase [Oceanicella sp. SM1341]